MSLPPPQPAYVFRGHAAQIHCTRFIRANTRLVTADADGWVVVWSLADRRPTAVWRAHDAAILDVAEWGADRLITHGKDNKLVVWKFSAADEAALSTTLPVEAPTTPHKQPWLLHVLPVNTLNFCSFAHCPAQPPGPNQDDALLLAVPNTINSEAVDIFHLPSQTRLHTVPGPGPATNTGMAMAVALLHLAARLTLVVGYESGHTLVTQLDPARGWRVLYLAHPHAQPVLSLALVPGHAFYLTSGADAVIAKHPLSSLSAQPSPPTPRPDRPQPTAKIPSGISANFAAQSAASSSSSANPPPPPSQQQQKQQKQHHEPATQPLKLVRTGHAGQQSLRIRSDARVFATAGWDARVRVYSVAGMRELAVLKWHKEGCYAVAFAEVVGDDGGQGEKGEKEETDGALVERPGRGLPVSAKEKRVLLATRTHWVAVGSKDGKVSLWEIY